MIKLSQVIDEFDALENYNKKLIDVNDYLHKRNNNLEKQVESYKRSEDLQKEIDKQQRKKCNSIKVQRDIFGVTSGAFAIVILILLI